MNKISSIVRTLRLRTLPLSMAGVVLGITLATADYHTDWKIILFIVLTAVLLQMLSNVSNELGDTLSGTDNQDRKGPKYSIQQGELTVREARILIIALAGLSILSGLAMIMVSFGTLFCLESFILVLLGASAVYAAVRYTLGPSPYGYKGLGDVAVFMFFGLASVIGSYFIVSHTCFWRILLPAVSVGAFSVAVLNVNNIRDMKTDSATRNTIPLRIGLKWARVYQTVLIVVGWVAMCVYSGFFRLFDPWHFLFVITLPIYIVHLVGVWTREDRNLDKMLPMLVLGTFFFSLTAGLGYVISLF